jgi:DNA modification methylase
LNSIRDTIKNILIRNTKNRFGGNKGDGNKTGIYSGNEWKPREDGKNPGSVSDFWDITTKPSNYLHYASYNEELIRKPILCGCPIDGLIYDPFMGTGSTAESALRAKRKFIGSEMSEKYIDIANKRLQPFLEQFNLL